MTTETTPISGDLRNVATKLDALDARITAAARGARTRSFLTLIAAVVASVIIGYWLWYAHIQFATQVTPDLAATMAQKVVQDNLPAASQQLEDSLKSSAPSVIQEGEKQFRLLPDRLRTDFHQKASDALNAEMPQLQARIYETLKRGLEEAQANINQVPGRSDEQKLRALAQSLAALYGQETMKMVDEQNAQYTKASGDIVNYLNLLAEGKKLTDQQKTQRNLVRDFLILAKESGAGPVDVQPVLPPSAHSASSQQPNKKPLEDMSAMEVAKDPAAFGFKKGGSMSLNPVGGSGLEPSHDEQWTKEADGKLYILTIHYDKDNKMVYAKWGGF